MNNPPAFPQSVAVTTGEAPISSNDFQEGAGMTLRDYFAAKAMAAIVTAAAFNQGAEDMLNKAGIKGVEKTERFISFMAYGFADAMLKEREEKK
jgi:hypothetical protein